MRATHHSGRYSGGRKHNDREFDLDSAPHIDQTKQNKNFYLSRYKGMPFAEAEQKFYKEYFKDMISDINRRADASRHKERRTSAEKLLSSKKTMPEEVIFQIGDKDTHVDMNVLYAVFSDFQKWHQSKFKNHVKLLNVAFHADEQTPHIHIRRVWVYDDPKGFKAIGQHKALEQMGYTLPDKSKKRSRFNNLKVAYTAECRKKWLEVCRNHGIDIEQTPKKRPISKTNLKKNDFIIEKQTEKLQELQNAVLSEKNELNNLLVLSLIHISEPTRPY